MGWPAVCTLRRAVTREEMRHAVWEREELLPGTSIRTGADRFCNPLRTYAGRSAGALVGASLSPGSPGRVGAGRQEPGRTGAAAPDAAAAALARALGRAGERST